MRRSPSYLTPVFHIVLWLMLAAFVISVLTSYLPFGYALGKAGFSFSMFGLIFYTVLIWLVPEYFAKGHYWRFSLISVLLIVVVGLVRYGLEEVFLNGLYVEEKVQLVRNPALANMAWLRLGFSNLVSYTLAFLYGLSIAWVRKQNQEREILALKYETELKQLMHQLHPHFLFNAIHNIYALAVVQDQQTAPMLLRLASVLRHTLYQSSHDRVPLSDEIKLINDLLAIYSMKFDPFPLQSISLPQGEVAHSAPPLVFLPIIENMFKHGDTDQSEGWRLIVEVQEGYLICEAQNPILEGNTSKEEGSGIGLSNVQKRLDLLFGQEAQLTAHEENGYFYLNIRFPLS